MKKIESLSLKYIGYQSPENEDEVDLELLGLSTVIAAAQQRMAVLKQSLLLTKLLKNSAVEEFNAQTQPETNTPTETK